MTSHNLNHFTSSPEYITLMQARKRIIWPLAFVTVVAYMAFILSIAFVPEMLGQTIDGGVISYGILLGLALILFNFLITMIYVQKANRTIEPLIQQMHTLVKE